MTNSRLNHKILPVAERAKEAGIIRRIANHLEIPLFGSVSPERRTSARNNLLKALNADYSINKLQKDFVDAKQIDVPTIHGIHLKYDHESMFDHISLELPTLGFIPEPAQPDKLQHHDDWSQHFRAHFLLQEAAAELFTEPITRKFSVLAVHFENSQTFSLSPFYDFSPTITDLLAFTNSKLYFERDAKKGQWPKAQWVINIGEVEAK